MKLGIIDVGGGFRSIFGAGVVDRCLYEHWTFDLAIGISAGSANLSALLSGQIERTYRFYTNYGFRKEYASRENYIKHRNFVNLDYIYNTLSYSDGEDPFDYEAFAQCPTDFKVQATNALTGQAVMFPKKFIKQNFYDVFKASGCVPVVNQAYHIYGVPYFDGGLSDPVPINYAFEQGCDKVVVILSRPADIPRSYRDNLLPTKLLQRHYPRAAHSLYMRSWIYNEEIRQLKYYEHEGRALIIAPTRLFGLDTLKRTHEGLEQMYRMGYGYADAIGEFISQ